MADTDRTKVIMDCQKLVVAYKSGDLGECILPEDNCPTSLVRGSETQLIYYTLPMSLNYRRNSDQLWSAAARTYDDAITQDIFSIAYSAQLSRDRLQDILLKYRMAMQPTRHTLNWHTIAQTVFANWGSLTNLLTAVDYDFLTLRDVVQHSHKKGFPYLAGPKLFNYWCYILTTKCDVPFKNKEHIDIAVDTHVAKCSVVLGVITQAEVTTLSGQEIAARWRQVLAGSEIAPVNLNVPLWFWSRNGFIYSP